MAGASGSEKRREKKKIRGLPAELHGIDLIDRERLTYKLKLKNHAGHQLPSRETDGLTVSPEGK